MFSPSKDNSRFYVLKSTFDFPLALKTGDEGAMV